MNSEAIIKVPEMYKAQYQINKERLISLKDLDDEWIQQEVRNGISLYSRTLQDSPVKMLRIETTLNATLSETIQLLFEDTTELVNSKEMIQSAEIVENLEEEGKVLLVTSKPKYFFSSREILSYFNTEPFQNGVIQVQVGLDIHPKVPTNDDAVRTTTHIGGYFLLPDSNNSSITQVIFIIHNLLNGRIPSFVQNMVLSQHIDGYVYYRRICDEKALAKAKRIEEEKVQKEKEEQEAINKLANEIQVASQTEEKEPKSDNQSPCKSGVRQEEEKINDDNETSTPINNIIQSLEKNKDIIGEIQTLESQQNSTPSEEENTKLNQQQQ